MIQIPITLERVVKAEEDVEVITEAEITAASQGGKIINKDKTLTEALYGPPPGEMLSLKQSLENE